MSTDDPDADGLVPRLRTLPPDANRSQVDDTFTVRPRTGDPLGRDFADQETVTGTADVLLPNRSVLYRRGLVADAALHHVLVRLALHGDGALTHPAADHRGAAAVRAALRGVRGRGLIWCHRVGERRLCFSLISMNNLPGREAVGLVVLIRQKRRPFPVRHPVLNSSPGGESQGRDKLTLFQP